MKILNVWCVAVFTVSFFYACSHSGRSNTESEPIPVATQVIAGQDSLLSGYVSDMQLRDSLLYVLDNKTDEYWIGVYQYPSLRLVNRFVGRGKGPQEMLAVAGFVVDRDSVKVISIQDPKRQSYAVADLKRGSKLTACIVGYAERYAPVLAAGEIEDGIVLIGSSAGRRLTVIDKQDMGKDWFKIQASQEVRSKMSEPMVGFLWQSVMACSGHRIVLGTKLGDVLEIYDMQDTTLSKVIVGAGGEPDMSKTGVFGKVAGFQAIKIRGNALFALYDGSDLERVAKLLAEGKQTQAGARYLRVYDLSSGELERVYQIDRYVSSFEILPDGKTVIATDPNTEHQLCTFTLPD